MRCEDRLATLLQALTSAAVVAKECPYRAHDTKLRPAFYIRSASLRTYSYVGHAGAQATRPYTRRA